MTPEQATALVLGCMREVAETEARYLKEMQENDAYLGGSLFVRGPRKLSEAEVKEIVQRRLHASPLNTTSTEVLNAVEAERAAIIAMLHNEARSRAHLPAYILTQAAGLIDEKFHLKKTS